MPGIGIITNPHSKLNKRNPQRSELLGYILGEQGKLEITRSLEHLDLVARKFRDSNIEVLAINGGDGTISRTLTAFIRAYGDQPLPKVALLRGGTMNVLATNLGLRGSPERLLFRLVEQYSSGDAFQQRSLHSLKIENHYGFLFADGIACTVLAEFYRNKTGPIGVLWLLARIIVSLIIDGALFKRLIRLAKSKIWDEHRTCVYEGENLTLMAATIPRMPMGPKLFPETAVQPERMQYFTVYCRPRSLLWYLPRVLLLARPGRNEYRFSSTATALTIQRDENREFSLDGEIHSSQQGEIKLEIGPVINFVLPR